jgi:lactoylglutathione lyase
MIKGLAHLCFITRDLDAAEDFYCRKLGFERAFDFLRDSGERFGMYIHVGGRGFIEIFKGDFKPAAEGQTYRHLCLEVEEFDATVAELRRRGVEVTDVKLGSDQSWQAWIKDPDGNLMELHGYTPASRQTPWLK